MMNGIDLATCSSLTLGANKAKKTPMVAKPLHLQNRAQFFAQRLRSETLQIFSLLFWFCCYICNKCNESGSKASRFLFFTLLHSLH